MSRIEDKDICNECGGKCCKERGCSYAPSDFKDGLTLEKVLEKIATGTVSITMICGWIQEDDKTTLHPVLLLKEKDIGKGDIDLVSIPTGCVSQTDTGCPYDFDSRPLGGACVIPNKAHLCSRTISTEELASMWEPYKEIMLKALQLIGEDSPDNILLGQIEDFLYEVKLAVIESRKIPDNTLKFASTLGHVCIQQNTKATERLTEYLISKPAYVKRLSILNGFSD